MKPGSAVVIGETDPDLVRIFAEAGGATVVRARRRLRRAREPARARRPAWSTCARRRPSTPTCSSRSTVVTRRDNAIVALTAVEAFFAAPVPDDVLREGFADVEMPGRFEVLGHQPLVIIDGAHNPPGADVSSAVFFEDFDPAGHRYLVVGCLHGRDPTRDALGAARRRVRRSCSPAPRRRRAGCRPTELTAAAKALGCDEVIESRDRRAGLRPCRPPRRRRRRDPRHRQPLRRRRRPPPPQDASSDPSRFVSSDHGSAVFEAHEPGRP